MFSTTTDVTQQVLGVIDLEGIDPYENWEKSTRPSGAALTALWQPVFGELVPDVSGSLTGPAATLLAQITTSSEIAAEPQTLALLARLAAGDPLREVERRFFVFRPEARAYLARLSSGAAIPLKILHLGPAVPVAFVGQTLTSPALPPLGTGRAGTVVTGIIDDVMGFANERFRRAPGGSRVERFWMQAMPAVAGGTATVGGEIDRAGIDALLASTPEEPRIYERLFPGGVYVIAPAPRGDLGLTPYESLNAQPFARAETHGTQVLDLAAGYPMGTAPQDRPILAVQLPQLATLETWGARLDLFILAGLQRLFHWADRWVENGQSRRAPLVVNISYGVLAGPKDGTGLIEQEIARMVAARNAEGVPTVVVLPAGNGYRDNCHAGLMLEPGATGDLTLRVQPDDQSVSFAEIWLNGMERLRLRITPPQGTPFDRLILPVDQVIDWQRQLTNGLKLTLVRIYVRPYPAGHPFGNGRTRVTVAFLPSQNHEAPLQVVPAGAYEMRLTNRGATALRAVIETQRDDTPPGFPVWGRQAYLDHPLAHGWDPALKNFTAPGPGSAVTRGGTLSGFGTAAAPGVVVVGAAFDRDALVRAALYCGAGPTPGRARPDLSAVSEETRAHPGVMTAATLSGGVTLLSGTSNAAPQVTRALVDLLSANPDHPLQDLTPLFAGQPFAGPGDDQLGRGQLPFSVTAGRPARRLGRGS